MRMIRGIPLLVSLEFETPHSIAHVDAKNESGVSEVIQTAEQRHTVEAVPLECLDDVSMTEGCMRSLQHIEDGQSMPRRSQPNFADDRGQSFRTRCVFSTHGRSIV